MAVVSSATVLTCDPFGHHAVIADGVVKNKAKLTVFACFNCAKHSHSKMRPELLRL